MTNATSAADANPAEAPTTTANMETENANTNQAGSDKDPKETTENHKMDIEKPSPNATEGDDTIKEAVAAFFNAKKGKSIKKVNSTEDGFTAVKDNKSTIAAAVENKAYRTGLLFIGHQSSNEAGITEQDLSALFGGMADMDTEAVIIPHNNDPKHAKCITEMKAVKNYSPMIDIHTTPWGSPSDNKSQLSFSFYIASNTMESLRTIKEHPFMVKFLKLSGFKLRAHQLHESKTKVLGYFMGKSVIHTNRDDVKERFTSHINCRLDSLRHSPDHKTKCYPKTIPIQIINQYPKQDGVEAEALGLVCGANDHALLEKILTKDPFRPLDIIMHSWKKSNPDEYRTQLLTHNALCNACIGIRVMRVSETILDHLKDERESYDPSHEKVIDMYPGRNYATDGVVYFQCHSQNRDSVTEWIKQTLQELHELQPNEPKPELTNLATPSIGGGSTVKEKRTVTPSVPIPQSKYQSLLDDTTVSTKHTKRTRQTHRPIPQAINTNVKSFAQALLADCDESAFRQTESGSVASAISSPGNSTIKTVREKELEEEVALLTQAASDWKTAYHRNTEENDIRIATLEKRADEEKAALTIQLLEQHKSAQEESIFKQEQKLTDALASQQHKYEIILVAQQQAFEAQISQQIKEMQEKYQEIVNGMEKNLDPTYRSPPHKKRHGENRPLTGHGRGPTPRSLEQEILNSNNEHSETSEKETLPGDEYMDIGSPTNKSVVSRDSSDAARSKGCTQKQP
jgi:hypothetical protein